ncbi:MAG: hypothetical protein FGM26_01310 [Beijerinckiaceae bacterium]|nr:hypothetical protein [Beijerinckiaceae bacterium]
MSLSVAPLIPLWLVLTLAGTGLAIALATIIARRRGGFLRLGATILMALALLNPSMVREEREKLKDVAVILVDRSGSQNLSIRAGQTDALKAEIANRLGRNNDLELRIVDIGETTSSDGTRLFGALQTALSDVPSDRVAGAILITDGVVHDIPSDPSALGFRAPVNAVITGFRNERDRRIELLDAPRFGLVGKEQTIRYRVLDPGRTEPVRLTLRRDGQTIGQRLVVPGETIRQPVKIEHGGANVFELDVEPAPGELTEANNKAVLEIDGIRDKLRVLLVSGQPHAGERTWRNTLKSDANVDLVHFTILRPPEKQDGTPINELSLIAFPTRELFETKIKDFDLIIFDRYSNQSILPPVYFNNIVRYVREGGAILVSAGPEFAGRGGLASTALSSIMPARPEGANVERPYRPALTDQGRRHPVTRELPGSQVTPPDWGEWIRQISATPRAGSTLMSGADEKPLLLLSREGQGRVALLLSDQSWLWARGFRSGGPHLDLLRRTGHWLMKEPDLEEEALRVSARGHLVSVERQSMAGSIGTVTVSGPAGQTDVTMKEDGAGRWRGSVEVKADGLYRATDGVLNAFVHVGPPNPREMQDVISNELMLLPLATATGGTVIRAAATANATPRLPDIVRVEAGSRAPSDALVLRDTQSYAVRGVAVTPLAVGGLGLLLIGLALLATWLREGRFRPHAS